MSEGNEIESGAVNSHIGEIDQGPAAFISYDEYPSVNNDVYSTLLSNVKLQVSSFYNWQMLSLGS